MQESTNDLQSLIQTLEQTISKAKEQEQLLIEYPDLHGPVNAGIRGTGDLAQDMDNQVRANTVRIRLLEEQNTRLRKTITKVLRSRKENAEQVCKT